MNFERLSLKSSGYNINYTHCYGYLRVLFLILYDLDVNVFQANRTIARIFIISLTVIDQNDGIP